MSALHTLSLAAIRDALARREVRAEDAVLDCLARIETTEPRIDALLHLRAEAAIEEARALDAAGPDASRPLWGVPVTVKDALTTAGTPTTAGSRILEDFVPFYDAFAVQRLREAGAIILGKNNMDEFAMGSSTENSAYKPTRNPWDTARVPGGSSGGSAASVAAGQCFASLGTDTGGSIRQPASLCGCVGLKPTYGRVSRFGLIAYGSSLDQIGPMTRTVEDAAIVMGVIAGHDKRDSTCADRPVEDFAAALASRHDLAGVRIGVPAEFWGEGLSPEVATSCRAALDAARDLGATIVDVALPHTPQSIAAYYIVASAEASSNLARYDGVRYGKRAHAPEDLMDLYVRSRSEGLGDEVQRRIMLGTYVLSSGYYDAYYRKAAQVRRRILEDYRNAFATCDVICGPVSPVTAWPLGALTADPLQMYLMDVFTLSLNLAGLPGLSLPVGLGTESGMPVGIQLLGRSFDEATLLSVGNVLSRALPPLGSPAGLR
ncbi:Asp-tRNA(Asn)/Glu-tRNA(Gln) amidotransferase subunit GatA [Nitratidesulfovibrio vulgaris]|uniref:Glutamyl-tRNA(Gln) amidotransferase subunit A n=1 Tax=Nitratidesulfovibrio vulgaris (strain DP4) TaxID=391774 RepID=GATA_NITV4|nr:Asp-tRNA(Asn)/Glu-tRNA(Gln) amidotransferase subunit GatA [Nitratidesulfovibrio vulgaris]A1VFG9.1 RecName: Full=Glutamyl-tRNA(Gln) amidotransferase subunit A; Short=Glu-ADT subunit A [Nitratidesulfovibrio vulgaris DP4]ABM29185.1 aspartyl/glutamyl-tRNA(Asn/Gln) amidotransferase subunit A [Nitratidesulfovibrio vulgaris DP4]GEB79825.1 glutamyl-tRNA(Gln) amidotransferase subunit A [Desulfovibrio desulfuricans]